MDQQLPALTDGEQAILKDRVVEKLKELDLFTGMTKSLLSSIIIACCGQGFLDYHGTFPISSVSADDVLPQYICVMVKNRKTPNEMLEQLNFVLADDTEEFVKWYVCKPLSDSDDMPKFNHVVSSRRRCEYCHNLILQNRLW